MTGPGYTTKKKKKKKIYEFFAFLGKSTLLAALTELALAAGSAGGRSVSSPSPCAGRTCHRGRTGLGVQSWLADHRDIFSVDDKKLTL